MSKGEAGESSRRAGGGKQFAIYTPAGAGGGPACRGRRPTRLRDPILSACLGPSRICGRNGRGWRWAPAARNPRSNQQARPGRSRGPICPAATARHRSTTLSARAKSKLSGFGGSPARAKWQPIPQWQRCASTISASSVLSSTGAASDAAPAPNGPGNQQRCHGGQIVPSPQASGSR